MISEALTRSGVVYLVGAGPGDPGLITVRGAKLLARADVVVYDYLSNPALLSYCPQADSIYVGKKAAHHTLTQDEINTLLIEKARDGRCVVRLKGGDPFVFGRGGEECEALAAAGVRFEVVPGITAALAVPAYAGIPVTHRDFNSSFTLITGHEREEEYKDLESRARAPGAGAQSSDLDWNALAKLPCIAFYMGVKSLPRICSKLIAAGLNPTTPAASIQWGTTPRQKTVVGTITDLADKVAAEKLGSPAITIIGRVVTLRETINWFESKPLFGQTIVVTRTRQQASDLSDRLTDLGAQVIEAPTIEIFPASDTVAIEQALKPDVPWDWVVFTSANSVMQTRKRLLEMRADARAFVGARIAALGQATAKAVREELCLQVDVCPESFVAEALADALEVDRNVNGKRFLLPRADIGRPVLRARLERAGAAHVRDLVLYETRRVERLPDAVLELLAQRRVNWITFTSSSTASNLVQMLGANYADVLSDVRLASIGPITSASLQAHGLVPAAVATTYDLDGLVQAILLATQEKSDGFGK